MHHTVGGMGEEERVVTSLSAPTDAMVESLVSDHLYLVQHLVHELAARFPRHVDRQELWSAGSLGLVEAARRYDPASEVPFGNYARRRIRGAILDSTRARDWATRGVRRHQRELAQATTAFQQEHLRAPTSRELADLLGVDEAEVDRRRAAVDRGTVLHLDQRAGQDGDDGGDDAGSLLDALAADGQHEPHAQLEHRELVGAMRTAVDHLADRQREILERSYVHGELLRDIADSLGVTEARVSQLRTEAVRALQALLAELGHVPEPATTGPGKRERAAFVARVTENTSWRQRLDAADAVSAWSGVVGAAG